MNECELLIRGGQVIDGTGSPRIRADVAVSDGRIEAVGDLKDWRSEKNVNAEGLIVAPGFIDVHTHDDRLLLSEPEMTPKVSQGVTTVVVGNCGVSLAPLVAEGDPPPPMNLLGSREHYRFPSFAAYASELEKRPAAVNAVMLVGHSTLRAITMDDLGRAATTGEIARMAALLDEALGSGCGAYADVGISAIMPTSGLCRCNPVTHYFWWGPL